MTTVAYDGKTIAADTLITGGVSSVSSKLLTFPMIPDGTFGAYAGDVGCALRFFRTWTGDPDSIPAGDYQALVCHSDGRVIYYNGDGLCLEMTDQKFAIGSGCEYAMGAMAAGKTAVKAAQIACTLDPNSGGTVESMRCHKVP